MIIRMFIRYVEEEDSFRNSKRVLIESDRRLDYVQMDKLHAKD